MSIGKIKIIGGNWRGRTIPVLDVDGLRPTPARVRETLFNWLQMEIEGSVCLDLFAGSGALGLEAVSRGALEVIQIENNPQICLQLQKNITHFQAKHINVIQQDVLNYLSTPQKSFDLIFLDPPFHKNLVQKTCELLEQNRWLKPYAKIYIETEKNLTLNQLSMDWKLLKEKTAGDVTYRLFQINNVA